jgi:predicted nucleic acid-binding protein
MADESRLVVDSTVFAALFLREPGFEDLAARLSSLRTVRTVPLFRFEVANAIWKSRNLTLGEAEAAIDALFRLPVSEEFGTADAAEAIRIARHRGHPLYDCAFVAIAKAEGFALWTLDHRLAEVARLEGVRVVS